MFALVVLVSLILRLHGLDWDQGALLHPDERFLAMVVLRLEHPKGISSYLDPYISTLSPFRQGFSFFVYGSLPVTVVFYISRFFHISQMDKVIVVGRFMSTMLDTAVGIFLYLIAELFSKKYHYSRYLSITAFALYSITVFAIQQSHFFTVDSWMVFGLIGGIYCFLRQASSRTTHWLLIGSLLFAIAISSKITALLFLPSICLPYLNDRINRRSVIRFTMSLFLIFLFVRALSPSYFHTGFFASVHELRNLSTRGTTFPPSLQWYSKIAGISPLIDVALWGIGIVQTILIIIALLSVIVNKGGGIRGREPWFLGAQLVGFYIYQSSQFVTSMRYFYPMYPAFALISAAALLSLWEYFDTRIRVLCVLMIVIWPLAFFHIYSVPNTRMAASEWIARTIPKGSALLVESWDDPLPVAKYNTPKNDYRLNQLDIYAPERNEFEKASVGKKIQDALAENEYIVISSSRGYGSLTRLADQYPVMTSYYSDLYAGRLGYMLVATFETRPQICILLGRRHCLIFQDQQADESFTVYDHPKVDIFKKATH